MSLPIRRRTTGATHAARLRWSVVFALLAPIAGLAWSASSSNYNHPAGTQSSGGGRSASTVYAHFGSLGQTASGPLEASPSYGFVPGFVAMIAPTQKASQSITFGAAPNVIVGGTGTVSATASSGLLVSFSVPPNNSYCSLSGTTITGLAVGLCSVYADQAGNGSYAPAPQAMLSFSIMQGATSVPSAPTNVTVQSGPGTTTITFTAPSNTGGAPIQSYTATCSAPSQATRSVTGSGTTLVVSGLKAGVAYSCSVTASNGTYTSAASATVAVTPKKASLTPILMLLLD